VAPQLCVSGATHPSDQFALVHGCITYSDGTTIWAVDPNHPANRISLGLSPGRTPIAWSRDGSRLLLMELRNGGTPQQAQDLYVMNAHGSQKRLTNDGLSGDGSFSPDGSMVVFSRLDDGLYVVDANGGTPRLIARSYLSWWLGTPTWSPDGSRIAYTVYLENSGTYEIWTVNPDGTDPRPLIDLGQCRASCAGGLAWSPDGSSLAFHSAGGTGGLAWSIYVVHVDGSGLRRLTFGVQPSWAPDGSQLAFSRGGDLFTMSPGGEGVTQVNGVLIARPFLWAWNPVG
jgi:Tol biopolymer transport system component